PAARHHRRDHRGRKNPPAPDLRKEMRQRTTNYRLPSLNGTGTQPEKQNVSNRKRNPGGGPERLSSPEADKGPVGGTSGGNRHSRLRSPLSYGIPPEPYPDPPLRRRFIGICGNVHRSVLHLGRGGSCRREGKRRRSRTRHCAL